jgi:hypothetical protein
MDVGERAYVVSEPLTFIVAQLEMKSVRKILPALLVSSLILIEITATAPLFCP